MVDHPRQPRPRRPARQAASPDAARPREVPETPAGGPDASGERVAKLLARAGVASRREVERLIGEGKVALNGRVLDTPAVKVGAGDILTVDGEVVGAAEPTRVWRYHKPVGLLTTHSDPKGRATVFQHLPEGLPRVISVGRLDLNSEGLLLLTNDGGLARALELPATGWVRTYRARAYGRVDQAKLDSLGDGITVEGVRYGPIEARLDKAKHRNGDRSTPANLWITVSLTEGKNREVRRVLEALGLKVNRLLRLAYGPFALGTLEVGAVEEVGPRVIREQLAAFIAPENLPRGDRVASAPLRSPGTAARGWRAKAESSPALVMGERGGPARAARRGGRPAPAATAKTTTGTPAQPGGARASSSRARPQSEGEGTAEKKAYKPGWARPKARPRPKPAGPKPRKPTDRKNP